MRKFRTSFLVRLSIVAFFLTGFLPGQAALAAQDSDTSFTNEDHNVTLTWVEGWEVTIPPDANGTIISIDRGNSVYITIGLISGDEMTPEEGVWLLYQEGDEIVEDNSSADPPSVSFAMSDVGILYYTESYSMNNGDTTVIVAMGTVPVLQETGFETVAEELTINGEPLFQGSNTGATDGPEDLTGQATAEPESRTSRTTGSPEATAEATEETTRTTRGTTETPEATAEATEDASRTSRTTRGTSETPGATEEAIETAEPTEESEPISRTPRTGSGSSETPVPTEEIIESPTEVATEVSPVHQGMDGYTGAIYAYTINYDPAVWEFVDTIETSTIDGVRLDGETSTVFFIGTGEYGADPVGCLLSEDAYYSAGTEGISDWGVATGADGAPLWYESDELAWGVFQYTFTSSTGEQIEFVDYISCETIPGQDAVLIVQLTSLPEEYNTNLDAVLDILDTIQFRP